MITAEQLKNLSNLDRYELARLLISSGYEGETLESVRFLGLTNGAEFCYTVSYFDDSRDGELTGGKVFVKYDAALGVTAEF